MGELRHFASGRTTGAGQALLVAFVAMAVAVFPPAMSAQATMNALAANGAVAHTGSARAFPSSQRLFVDAVKPAPAVTPATTAAAPKVEVKRTPVIQPPKQVAPVVPVSTPTPQTASSSSAGGYGCGPALSYLATHAAPGFRFECPGWADGHQAMTCMNVPGVCAGSDVIAISTPCAAAYMNEASNSWVLSGKSDAPIDPYGYCS